MSDLPWSLKARYLFPIDRQPLQDGYLTVRDGRISEIQTQKPAGESLDLGNVAILPGFVNPHTHLEFSELAHPLGRPGMSFPDWIRAVVERRRAISDRDEPAIRQGLAESTAAGVTTLGEIATSEAWRAMGPEYPLDLLVFRELLGMREDRRDALTQLATDHLDAVAKTASPASGRLASQRFPGLAPHAPYSVHSRVIQRAMRLSRDRGFPIALHLAESREEIQLLEAQEGPLVELLEEFAGWDPDSIPPHTRPLDYLAMVAPAQRSLIIHGNYLEEEEMDFLAARAERMTLVYCPRTHAYFQHAPYPLVELLERGVQMAVGTDSRASNPDLSILTELRFLADRHPQIPLAIVLKLGTLNAARSLGLDPFVGSLSPRKWANLAIVPLPDRDAADPHELLLHSNEPVCATYYRGEKVNG
ncbi:MAG TPA: amidohydrolase family protein [Pirellulales bacterium]|jgi:cytosine/adenosine deaminase-related metal-dependent hydrolase|nr:amidohydrolase family protein [Pirellulales bacterium]